MPDRVLLHGVVVGDDHVCLTRLALEARQKHARVVNEDVNAAALGVSQLNRALHRGQQCSIASGHHTPGSIRIQTLGLKQAGAPQHATSMLKPSEVQQIPHGLSLDPDSTAAVWRPPQQVWLKLLKVTSSRLPLSPGCCVRSAVCVERDLFPCLPACAWDKCSQLSHIASTLLQQVSEGAAAAGSERASGLVKGQQRAPEAVLAPCVMPRQAGGSALPACKHPHRLSLQNGCPLKPAYGYGHWPARKGGE